MNGGSVVDAYGESLRGSKIYLGGQIPSELLTHAIENFGQSLEPSDIGLLADGSESGYGGEGLLITSRYIAFRNRSAEATRLRLEDVRSIDAKHGKFMSVIVLNGSIRIELWGFKQPWISALEHAISAAAGAASCAAKEPQPENDQAAAVITSVGDSIHRQSTVTSGVDKLSAFLKRLDLERLQPAFAEHNITYDLLQDLSDDDLSKIGVKALGDRRVIQTELQKAVGEQDAAVVEMETLGRVSAGKKASSVFWTISALAPLAVFAVIVTVDKKEAHVALPAGLAAFLAVTIYLLPAHIAFSKQSEYRWAILLANLFFGATVIGWVILFFWSLSLINAKSAAVLGGIAAISRR
jgi:hypothetical protein